jgi:hypothetical protein
MPYRLVGIEKQALKESRERRISELISRAQELDETEQEELGQLQEEAWDENHGPQGPEGGQEEDERDPPLKQSFGL